MEDGACCIRVGRHCLTTEFGARSSAFCAVAISIWHCCLCRSLILEHAVYYVASPEACAAILWKSRDKAATVRPRRRLICVNMGRATSPQMGWIPKGVQACIELAEGSFSNRAVALGGTHHCLRSCSRGTAVWCGAG